ncbi:MAG: hypothetical protein V4530_01785 [Pseudomonadota bacterium]
MTVGTRATFALGIAAICMSACERDPRQTRIIVRVPSPGGDLEAVYAEGLGGGATVGPSEEVYVVTKGASPTRAAKLFSAEHVCNLRVSWRSNEVVEVGYHARKPLPDGVGTNGRIKVAKSWLGSDPANGC